MYIHSIDIAHIRAIDSLKMRFAKPAGWHVIIGDNGTGKSSVVRAIALALIGPEKAMALRLSWDEWLAAQHTTGHVRLHIVADPEWDKAVDTRKASVAASDKPFPIEIDFSRERVGGFSPDFASPHSVVVLSSNIDSARSRKPRKEIWGDYAGWFSVAYGPFRRFTGGNPEWAKLFYSSPKVGAHLSAFGEDVALTEALEWLRELDYQRLKQQEADNQSSEASHTLDYLKRFVNDSGLLPHGTRLDRIETGGPIFLDGNGNPVPVTQLSDGYRSVLSLTFELIRQLVRVYGYKQVFHQLAKNRPDKLEIGLPGVVVIDEIDAHLHPTWQTRIGQWFLQYFPRMQFIVTTHSPLICRAAAQGSIYRLVAPGEEESSGEVTGLERDRLIYGNILDAYATDAFGENITQSPEAQEKLTRLIHLNRLYAYGKLNKADEAEMYQLRQIFTTDDTFAF
ncbi:MULTISPECIES: AAA family ATPase [Hymenobacter]|uniref:Predicted ATP-binding protein involved in virulence n=1 Tax=Hymenobacter psychrotolerans DSM 18569 TaxID=1121959 RepID=A0A1M6ZUQ8_9BACT|nr:MULTISPECIES: AAA family ATPase [Hymenobacter]QNE42135.1 AAA family ATPase [Hymenobacter sp. NBH84]SHL34085.1 Predicted ATP-binding protein involved in virulence [Hymenobacter psychrotolerans DSM 18569]